MQHVRSNTRNIKNAETTNEMTNSSSSRRRYPLTTKEHATCYHPVSSSSRLKIPARTTDNHDLVITLQNTSLASSSSSSTSKFSTTAPTFTLKSELPKLSGSFIDQEGVGSICTTTNSTCAVVTQEMDAVPAKDLRTNNVPVVVPAHDTRSYEEKNDQTAKASRANIIGRRNKHPVERQGLDDFQNVVVASSYEPSFHRKKFQNDNDDIFEWNYEYVHHNNDNEDGEDFFVGGMNNATTVSNREIDNDGSVMMDDDKNDDINVVPRRSRRTYTSSPLRSSRLRRRRRRRQLVSMNSRSGKGVCELLPSRMKHSTMGTLMLSSSSDGDVDRDNIHLPARMKYSTLGVMVSGKVVLPLEMKHSRFGRSRFGRAITRYSSDSNDNSNKTALQRQVNNNNNNDGTDFVSVLDLESTMEQVPEGNEDDEDDPLQEEQQQEHRKNVISHDLGSDGNDDGMIMEEEEEDQSSSSSSSPQSLSNSAIHAPSPHHHRPTSSSTSTIRDMITPVPNSRFGRLMSGEPIPVFRPTSIIPNNSRLGKIIAGESDVPILPMRMKQSRFAKSRVGRVLLTTGRLETTAEATMTPSSSDLDRQHNSNPEEDTYVTESAEDTMDIATVETTGTGSLVN